MHDRAKEEGSFVRVWAAYDSIGKEPQARIQVVAECGTRGSELNSGIEEYRRSCIPYVGGVNHQGDYVAGLCSSSIQI